MSACTAVGTSGPRPPVHGGGTDACPRADLLGDDCDGIALRHHLRVPTLHIAQDDAADELLSRDPLALVLGMLLDQQFPMERAFGAPRLLADRLGVGTLSAAELAGMNAEELVRLFQGPPALHRYPGSMSGRTQELCRLLVERYDGRAEALWADVPDGRALLRRVAELPGF